MERKMEERRERLAAPTSGGPGALKIVDEVGKLAHQQGFTTCPLIGHQMHARMDGRGDHLARLCGSKVYWKELKRAECMTETSGSTRTAIEIQQTRRVNIVDQRRGGAC